MCWLRLFHDLHCDHIPCILTPYLYLLSLDVVLISPLWAIVSHKCCNCASKILLLCFHIYSCFLLTFRNSSPCPRNPYEVMMLIKDPHGDIACKGTSLLHEFLFCVGQDSLLKLPYGHIACKGTSLLHELLFVLGKTPLWSFLMVTLPARVLHPFMNCSFVLGKMPFWSCLMVTLPARVLHPFMNCSFVLD